MDKIFAEITKVFDWVIEYAILIIEIIGVAVIMFTVIRGVVHLFQKRGRLRLELAEGFALALEFKIGSELLRTVIVREWQELLILGCVILLRAALTFLIHWEIGIERKNETK